MKTPWKFLAELASRRRSAKERESSIERDIDPAAQGRDAEQTPTPGPAEFIAPADDPVPVERAVVASNEWVDGREAAQASAQTVDGEEARIEPPSQAHGSHAGADVPAETSAKSRRKPRLSRAERTKRSPATVVAPNAVASHERQSAGLPSSPDAFFDEVASLDGDIKRLRSELARKLQRQNAQLKAMLKRFDVS